jgi:glutamyl-tRNA reductase
MHISQLVCLGISHHTATVELREYLANPVIAQERPSMMREMVLVATCNRVELYAYVDADAAAAQGVLVDFLARIHHMHADRFVNHTYFFQGEDAVRHLCRVAAGLDSLVIGEPQILGQVIDAFQATQQLRPGAVATGYPPGGRGQRLIGPALSLLFRTAIQAGKRARTETAISTNPASISSVAVALAHQVMGDIRRAHTLVVGLGEMGRLTVKALRSRGVTGIDIANRTRAKAEQAVKAWDGDAFGLDELATALQAADIVFTAATVSRPVLDVDLLREVMARRTNPLIMIDLGVPRNVDPAAGALPNVHLFDVDDLRASLDEALSVRQREIPRVEAIIDEEVAGFTQRFQELVMEPVIADLRQKAEAIRQRELERTLRFLGDVDPETQKHIQHLTRALVNKLLHEPTVRLKQKAADNDASDLAATFRELFGLNLPSQINGDVDADD